MSSQKTASRNISTSSKKASLQADKWEVNLIGSFLLDLYHRSILSPKDGWSIKKSEMRAKFSKFATAEQRGKLKKLHGVENIGNLLERFGFLYKTSRDGSSYVIKHNSLNEFRNNKLKELDNFKLNNDVIIQDTPIQESSNKQLIVFEEEIDVNAPKESLQYQGSTSQARAKDFCPNNMSCFICQKDFITMESFEEHVQMHADDTDFAFLTKLDKSKTPFLAISYRLCKNSHNFCFEIESFFKNLIIEKIIIVQSRSFFYVHNMRVPYKCAENGVDRFFVDSHLFTIHLEQPIVIIYHLEGSAKTLFIEQHHFMRSEEFPKVKFSINPNRLHNKKLFESKVKLKNYFPTKELRDALAKDVFYDQSLMKISGKFGDYINNGKKLQPQTMAASLKVLLQIEDMDTMQGYLSLKQNDIRLRSYGDEYSFQIKRQQRVFVESILSAYDEVILTTRSGILRDPKEVMKLMLQNTSDINRMDNTFVGQIQAVNTGRISFKSDKKLNLNGSYAVIFRPNRLNIRYQYRSLELLPYSMDFLKKFLFPTNIIPLPLPNIRINLYNKNINDEQLQAVRNMAEGPRNDATYIIFGSPGTGKTTTLVEGILQILRKPNSKILVTASSNSACDEVALRLCKFLPQLDITRSIVRIYSRSRESRSDTIDDELLENSNMYNGQFYPDIGNLHEYRVVICTLSVVGKLATGRFGRGVYTHIIIDEVAATMETEALIPITAILTPKSCLIIAGDNKQLGPILQSKRATELGLDVSLMDRLLQRDCYRVDIATGNYDRTIQTRLIRNFRSHPAIVNLYSSLYYNNSLKPSAKRDDVSLSEFWHNSPNKQYPILFHAVYEASTHDSHSHSLYNLAELRVVMDYVKDFMYFGINGEPVKESDIGIISPYKKQYTRIQEELNLRKWFGIEVGSVETFQGKEKNIIIASFVRSGTPTLGFLDEPRRLNVTLSRPKCILILIGNPDTLSVNKDFDYVIRECRRNNTFVKSNSLFKKISDLSKTLQSVKVNEYLSTSAASNFAGQNSNLDKNSAIDQKKTSGSSRTRRRNNRNKENLPTQISNLKENSDQEQISGIIKIKCRRRRGIRGRKSGRGNNVKLNRPTPDTILTKLPPVPQKSQKSEASEHYLMQRISILQQESKEPFNFLLKNKYLQCNNNLDFVLTQTTAVVEQPISPILDKPNIQNQDISTVQSNANILAANQQTSTKTTDEDLTNNLEFPRKGNLNDLKQRIAILQQESKEPFNFLGKNKYLQCNNNLDFVLTQTTAAVQQQISSSKTDANNLPQSKAENQKSAQKQTDVLNAVKLIGSFTSAETENLNESKSNKNNCSHSKTETGKSPRIAANFQLASSNLNGKNSENTNISKNKASDNERDSSTTQLVPNPKSASAIKPEEEQTICSTEGVNSSSKGMPLAVYTSAEKTHITACVKPVVRESVTKSLDTSTKISYANNHNHRGNAIAKVYPVPRDNFNTSTVKPDNNVISAASNIIRARNLTDNNNSSMRRDSSISTNSSYSRISNCSSSTSNNTPLNSCTIVSTVYLQQGNQRTVIPTLSSQQKIQNENKSSCHIS